VEQANSPSPEQSTAKETATGEGAQTTAQGAAQGAGQTVPKAATGPVGIAMVAAEATHQGAQAAGNTVSEGSKGQQ
jgi:hypothetical protein